MIEIIKNREHMESVSYNLTYRRANNDSRGYGFDCDKDGNVFPPKSPEAQRSLDLCRAGKDCDSVELVKVGVEKSVHQWTESAIGRCTCGREVELSGFTNTCECGLDYNFSGQQLTPRSQWGYETGESLDDILMIP